MMMTFRNYEYLRLVSYTNEYTCSISLLHEHHHHHYSSSWFGQCRLSLPMFIYVRQYLLVAAVCFAFKYKGKNYSKKSHVITEWPSSLGKGSSSFTKRGVYLIYLTSDIFRDEANVWISDHRNRPRSKMIWSHV